MSRECLVYVLLPQSLQSTFYDIPKHKWVNDRGHIKSIIRDFTSSTKPNGS